MKKNNNINKQNKKTTKTSDGVVLFMWLHLGVGIIMSILHANKLADGSYSGFYNTLAIIFYILAGVYFWIWLITRTTNNNKATEKTKKQLEKQGEQIKQLKSQNAKIEQLQKQIEELKNKEQ